MNGKVYESLDYGGSLYMNDTSTVEIINCIFFTNEAVYSGGGAININNSISIMINTTISNNNEKLINTNLDSIIDSKINNLKEVKIDNNKYDNSIENNTDGNNNEKMNNLKSNIISDKDDEIYNNKVDDIYNNNVWILDDRFMSYGTILSDEVMAKVVQEIALDDIKDDSKPDITMVFSGNPDKEEKVNVVVVELKKHGLPLAKNEEVVSQLRQRARKLLKYFPNKIERIWFYGISDIDSEFRISLIEDGFKELFSHGQIFFKPQNIIVTNENTPFTVDLFIMTYESLISDSESRNSTFLRILKSSIQKSSSF